MESSKHEIIILETITQSKQYLKVDLIKFYLLFVWAITLIYLNIILQYLKTQSYIAYWLIKVLVQRPICLNYHDMII